MQQLSGYFLQLKFDPELLFSVQFQYRNRIAVEFNQLYRWHPLMPDTFKVGSQEYSYEQFLFNTSMLVDYGVEALVDAFSRQSAGRVSLRGTSVGTGGLCDPTGLDLDISSLFYKMGTVSSLQSGCKHSFIRFFILSFFQRYWVLHQLLGI